MSGIWNREGKDKRIDREWNVTEWIPYLKRLRSAENFEPHHGFVQMNTREVMMNLYLISSNGMDRCIMCGRSFVC